MANIVDGNALAGALFEELEKKAARLAKKPRLCVVHFSQKGEESSFVRKKLEAGKKIGVSVRLRALPQDISANELRRRLNTLVHEARCDGIVVQLPLPKSLDTNRYKILRIIPETMDVDCISEKWLGRLQSGRTTLQGRHGSASFLPPVVGAIERMLKEASVEVSGKRVVIVGWGSLVGKPAAAWFLNQGATVTVTTKSEPHLAEITRGADILVTGTGSPGLITNDMVGEQAVILDAGTSEQAGSVTGDAAFEELKDKVSLITPVPGGIGPLAVAVLLRNLVSLVAMHSGYRKREHNGEAV